MTDWLEALDHQDLPKLSDSQLSDLVTRLEGEAFVNNACQQAVKVNLNSAYGTFSSPYCQWYSRAIGEAITVSGQLHIRMAGQEVNAYLSKILGPADYVLGGDTDSLFVSMSGLVNRFASDSDTARKVEFVDTVCKGKLAAVIDASVRKIVDQSNAYRQAVRFKREVIAEKAIFIGKKRYAMYVHDKEGIRYPSPKLKVTGIEIVRSTTPPAARDALKECLMLVFSKGEGAVQEFIAGFHTKWMGLPANDISRNVGVPDLNDYYDAKAGHVRPGKTIPLHVKGIVAHNQQVIKLGLKKQVEMIKSGDKVRYSYLRSPNPVGVNCFAWIGDLNPKLGMDRYIDREVQFEKGFLGSIKNILDAIGWKTENTPDLSGLFG